jgi:hypothetical protein
VELDHVIVAVSDLDAAARALESRHGLVSADGGRHPAWGTANRIVPLGETYLELVAVVDRDAAAESAFGRWVAGSPGGPLGWVVRTPTLDDVAARRGLDVTAGCRELAGGRVLRWRLAGIEQAAAEPCLPFFLQWADDAPLPGEAPVDHPAGEVSLARVELTGDAARVTEWLDEPTLPVIVGPGLPGVARLVVRTGGGEIVLDGPL